MRKSGDSIIAITRFDLSATRLILRLSQPLPEGRLEEINQEFADILQKGRIEETGPLSDESNEPHIAHLERVVLYFDRTQYGRLRRLIDRINEP